MFALSERFLVFTMMQVIRVTQCFRITAPSVHSVKWKKKCTVRCKLAVNKQQFEGGDSCRIIMQSDVIFSLTV